MNMLPGLILNDPQVAFLFEFDPTHPTLMHRSEMVDQRLWVVVPIKILVCQHVGSSSPPSG